MIWPLLAIVAFGLLYDTLTTFWLKNWLRTRPIPPQTLPPITWFRPLKAGVPNLEKKLTDFLSAISPRDQVLLAIDETDTTSELILSSTAPLRALRVLRAKKSPEFLNPKVSKLLQLTPLAIHDHWILLDSELDDPAPFLTRFRNEWAAADFPLLSTPYKFHRLTLDTFPVLATLLPGLSVLKTFHKTNLTLGACVAITRDQLTQLGGWESFAHFLAEDYELGHAAVAHHIPVALSTATATLDNDPSSLRATLLHLHRVAVTYRVCQPWGFAGSLINHTLFWTLLTTFLLPMKNLLLLLVFVYLTKTTAAFLRARLLHWHINFPRVLALGLLSPWIETACWFLAWLPLPIFWATRFWRIKNRRLIPRSGGL